MSSWFHLTGHFLEEEIVHKARTVEVAKEPEIGPGKGDDQVKIKEWSIP